MLGKLTVSEGQTLMLESSLPLSLSESCLFQIKSVLVAEISCIKLSEVFCQGVFML